MTGPSSPTTSADDHARRTFKRDRESDASSQLPTTPSETLPAKKNRLEVGDGAEGHDFAASDRDNPNGSNAQAVRHISQKVNELSWEERQKLGQSPILSDHKDSKDVADAATGSLVAGIDNRAANQNAQTEKDTVASPNGPALVKPTSKLTAFGAGAGSSKSPQLSFNAFAAASNPFSTKVTGPSIFGSATSKSTAFSKPPESNSEEAKEKSGSASGSDDKTPKDPQSSAGTSTSTFAASSALAPSDSGSSAKKTPQLSFNAFSSAPSPFSSSRLSATSGSAFGGTFSKGSAFSQASSSQTADSNSTSWLSTPSAQQDPKAGADASPSAEASSSDADDESAEVVRSDNAIPFQRRADEDSSAVKATDRTTGEESEKTIFSTRAKLYEMEGTSGNWKERGTGTIKCNVPNEAVGGLFGAGRGASGPGAGKRRSPARLVMRTDGVLRLILNVVLFHGMTVELAQEKFVRFGALEDGKLVTLALRVSQAKVAEDLFQTIQSRIPPPQHAESRPEAETAAKSSTGSEASQSGSSQ